LTKDYLIDNDQVAALVVVDNNGFWDASNCFLYRITLLCIFL